MRTHPEGIHRIDCRLARRSQCKLYVQRRQTAVRDPVDLFFEAFDVLGFFHELVFGNKKREESLLMLPVHKFAKNRICRAAQ